MSTEINAKLFPIPSQFALSLPSQQAGIITSRAWPGVSPSSTETLRRILSDNHNKWHTFFNDRMFHNHIPHAALTLWCLGADPSILEASYKQTSTYQRHFFTSPGPITRENWRDHLGDENYYASYLQFMKEEFENKDMAEMLEEYVLAASANHIENVQSQPQMLARYLEGAIHPLIHAGFGIEFGVPGVFLEGKYCLLHATFGLFIEVFSIGLAQAAVHPSPCGAVIPRAWFDNGNGKDLAQRFSTAVEVSGKPQDVHAFTIVARLVGDKRITPPQAGGDVITIYTDVMNMHGDAIAKYVGEWTLEGDLTRKVEELLWTQTLIYGVGGLEVTGGYNADFFLMHLVTSSLFLPTTFPLLKRSSQIRLLRSYFSVSLAWYIARGRPALNIKAFFSNPNSLVPTAPGPHPTPNKVAQPAPDSPSAITPNAWLQIIQSTLVHPDDHVCKLQRALAEYGALWGHIGKGYFKGTELKDAELIDGTLFIRTAGLTAGRVGWVREGEPQLTESTAWDYRGFFPAVRAKA
ncbi:unnamed protein product [Cyclocybe aegerita]|uniref:Oxidoreductase AflY n=1 Tax=Cyclocybe aegerita TaxID=1973307 RepID=A0A8S0WWZ1_CYCAE|nr:unnamed protein product [Cyclocybe aegerita]